MFYHRKLLFCCYAMFRCALAADAGPQLSLRVPAGVRVAHVGRC